MAQVIEVTPDENGRLFVRLYGTDHEIVIKEKPAKKGKKTDEPAAE